MPNTYKKIASVVVGSGGSSTINFTSIPQTFTDLKIVLSGRSTNADIDDHLFVKPNSSASNMTQIWLRGSGSAASSSTSVRFAIPGATSTASVFGNTELYFPNYTSANFKSFSGETVQETNGTEAYQYLCAFLWSDTAAITSLVLDLSAGNFVQYTTATLYGIGDVTASKFAKATGGLITYDSTYVYHTFTSSGVFTPNTALTCDYLVIAGGGGGAIFGGGGGAGGYRTGTLSVTSGAKTVTVGSGGAGTGTQAVTGVSGSNSVFDSITSNGGGGGGAYGSGSTGSAGLNGGSGGGGGSPDTGGTVNGSGGTGNLGNYSPVEGFAGGTGTTNNASYRTGGGGGGSSQAGTNGGTTVAGSGGNGTASSITGISVIRAGGGGGGANSANTAGTGGTGGAGNGANQNSAGSSATINTGSGGGGGGNASGGNGGSGIVIVRYLR
jgi:hypothetical protein